jgi:hypothetical protein
MTQIGAQLDHPANYDGSWAVACNVNNDSQYLLVGQPDVAMVTDCEFLAPMLTPILAGQMSVVNCNENYVKAVYDTPRYYATLPQKHVKCQTGRTCGDAVSTANGPEYFQLTTEDHSIPMTEDVCGMGGCGTHPMAGEMTSPAKLMEAQFDTFQLMIDVRFMKYVYSPVADNLAVAEVTAAPTITITTPTGDVDVVDYAAIRSDFVNSITTVLTDQELAMGYDDSIQPVQVSTTDLNGECVCCLDSEGLQRIVGYIQQLSNEMFKASPASKGITFVANPNDVDAKTLMEMQRDLLIGTTLALPFVQAGLTPDSVVSEHEAYNILGHTLILSYMAPEGTMLAIPSQVREYINFAQSGFETKVNAASNCDWEGWHLAKKTFGWFIPSCYRDKYFLIDMTGMEECCKLNTCSAPY